MSRPILGMLWKRILSLVRLTKPKVATTRQGSKIFVVGSNCDQFGNTYTLIVTWNRKNNRYTNSKVIRKQLPKLFPCSGVQGCTKQIIVIENGKQIEVQVHYGNDLEPIRYQESYYNRTKSEWSNWEDINCEEFKRIERIYDEE